MTSLIDIENTQLTFNGKNVFIILGDKNGAWFKGKYIAEILEYNDTKKAISNNVDEEDQILLEDLIILKGG